MKIATLGALFSLCATGAFAGSSEAMATYLENNIAPWVNEAVLIDAIRAQNEATASLSEAEIIAKDEMWRGEVGTASTPTIDPVLTSAAADFLRTKVEAAGGDITEVFIMDAVGLNVAASDVTSDYWQGDEAKFQDSFGAGAEGRHFSEIEFDESTRSYQAQISMTITDPDSGKPIGAVTVGVNAEAFE